MVFLFLHSVTQLLRWAELPSSECHKKKFHHYFLGWGGLFQLSKAYTLGLRTPALKEEGSGEKAQASQRNLFLLAVSSSAVQSVSLMGFKQNTPHVSLLRMILSVVTLCSVF